MSELSGMMDELAMQEMTASANIAFLPGGFAPVSKLMKDLAKIQRSYSIEILDQPAQYTVQFERDANIVVPKPHWSEFLEHFNKYVHALDGTPGLYEIDLGGFLEEGIDQEVQALRPVLVDMIMSQLVNGKLGHILESARLLADTFPGQTISHEQAVLPRKRVPDLVEELMIELGDDLMGVQALMAAIEERAPLSTFPVFERYPFLFGQELTAIVNGIKLVFETVVTMEGKPVSSVRIADVQVMESLSSIEGQAVIKNLLIPSKGYFDLGDVERIREAVDAIDGEVVL